MVWLEDLSEFIVAAREMYARRIEETRFCLKYRKGSQPPVLVAKVTDNVTCLKYKTSLTSDMRHIDKAVQLFMHWSIAPTATIEKGGCASLPLEVIPPTATNGGRDANAVGAGQTPSLSNTGGMSNSSSKEPGVGVRGGGKAKKSRRG